MMKTTINKAPIVPCNRPTFNIRGSRLYHVFHLLDPECVEYEKFRQEVVLQRITNDVAQTIQKKGCLYHLMEFDCHAWGMVIWHAKDSRCIKVYKDGTPSPEWVIPCGAILFIFDPLQEMFLLSTSSHKCDVNEVLQCFSPLFKQFRRWKEFRPHWVSSEALKRMSYEMRHPSHPYHQMAWQHLRLKEIRYLPQGEIVELTHRTWQDDGFLKPVFQTEVCTSTVKEFTLMLDTTETKRPISLLVKNNTNIIKATLNSSTLQLVTSTLNSLFNQLPPSYYAPFVR